MSSKKCIRRAYERKNTNYEKKTKQQNTYIAPGHKFTPSIVWPKLHFRDIQVDGSSKFEKAST
jgi:hypothetical protein